MEIPAEEAYHLSCWTYVLAIHDDNFVAIAVDSKHEENVLKKIEEKGTVNQFCFTYFWYMSIL